MPCLYEKELDSSFKQISKVTLESAFSDQVAGVRVEYELTDAIDIRDCELSEPTPVPTCNVIFDTINFGNPPQDSNEFLINIA